MAVPGGKQFHKSMCLTQERKDMEVLRMEKRYLSISWGSGS